MQSALSVVRFVLQSLEIAAQKTHSLQKKGLREGILAILAPAVGICCEACRMMAALASLSWTQHASHG